MNDTELSAYLARSFEASGKSGKPVAVMLERGLKGKAQAKGEARGLLLWRERGELPSAATCARLALCGGILKPVYAQKMAGEFDAYMMTEGAMLTPVCPHVWGATVKGLNKKTETENSVCERCEVVASIVTRPIAGKPSTKYIYDSLPVSAQTLKALKLAGPVPQSMGAQDRAAFSAPTQPVEAQQPTDPRYPPWPDLPPSPPAQSLTGQVCGTCRSGLPTEYGEIECLLGWAAHDPEYWIEYEQKERDGTVKMRSEVVNGFTRIVPVTRWVVSNKLVTGHGEALAPFLAPQTACMCRGGSKWLPKRAAASPELD